MTNRRQEICTYPRCKCIVSTSTSQPIPQCPKGGQAPAKRRQDLIAALVQIQNHPVHQNHDILTIHGCAPLSTEAELLRAIEDNMQSITRWSNYGGNKRRLARAA